VSSLRSALIPVIHKMIEGQGFAGKIGEAALLADEKNLEILVNAFPMLFEGQAWEKQKAFLTLVK
jgi:hypothetical protein